MSRFVIRSAFVKTSPRRALTALTADVPCEIFGARAKTYRMSPMTGGVNWEPGASMSKVNECHQIN